MTNEKDELHDRVEQLEQTVQQQQNTIKKMLPNRRQALKGVGLLAGGGLLGAAGGPASAATGSAGQIGTTSDRPDAFTDTLDSNVVSTGDAVIDSTLRFPRDNISLSTNEITPSSPSVLVKAGDGTNLQTINNPNATRVLVLQFGNSVTVEDNNGNIRLDQSTNETFNTQDTLMLISDDSLWYEVSRTIH